MFVSLTAAIVAFGVAALVLVVAGTRMARQADILADQTGMGEALFGIVFLAGITSLPDFAATLSAALDDRPDLAMSNVMGSMAVNLAFLGVADIIYRKANLEHAAASAANLMLAGLLIALLTLPLLATFAPTLLVRHVHAATPVIVAAYLFGLHLVKRTQTVPMWFPRLTSQTVSDTPDRGGQGRTRAQWIPFLLMAATTGFSGWILMEAAKTIVDGTGLPETVIGGLFTALATSTPELVATIAAVRIGAVTLAISNIFGTNCFNMLVVAAADAGYLQGSIYHDMDPVQMAWGLVSILMTAILLLGLVRRETYGIGRIGFESALILGVYAIAVSVVVAVA